MRSRVVLLASDGLSGGAIAARLNVSPGALAHDAPGRRRRAGMSLPVTMAVLRAMLDVRAGAGGGAVTTRGLAVRVATSASTVWRAWKRYGVGPSTSPSDIARAWD